MKLRLLIAASLVALGSAANAVTITNQETCTIGDVHENADMCFGHVDHDGNGGLNDSENSFNNDTFVDGGSSTVGIFGHRDWDQVGKVDVPDGFSSGTWTTGDLTLTLGGQTSPWDGSWDWAGAIYEDMLIVLKQSSSYSVYWFKNGSFDTSGLWDTTVAAFGNNQGGISHLSLYARGEMSDIPLPAAGWLLVAGLGGMAAMRRRKS